MTLYAQHGYGKSDKIESGLADGSINGLILSPRDEKPDNLASSAKTLRADYGNNVQLLVDPQFYATTITPARDGYLPDYEYYQPGLTRSSFIAQKRLQQYASNVLQFQKRLPLDRMLSPGVFFNDFNDPWSQINLSLFEASISTHNEMSDVPPLLLSLVFDESALKNKNALDEFLDILTVWEVKGFYILVQFSDAGYPCQLEEVTLANLMYLVYVLAEVNGFEVVCGFSDFIGLLLRAVGAEAFGTGWYNSLRQFSLRRFQPATGGKTPRPRYSSGPLLNSILIVPELDTAFQQRQLKSVLSGTKYDRAFSSGNPANANWPRRTECLHHWAVLCGLEKQISSKVTVAERLGVAKQLVDQSTATYNLLSQSGVLFQAETGPRNLEVWTRAINSLRSDAGI